MTEPKATIQNSDVEEWRPAPGFESFYDVSSFGRVRRTAPGNNTFVGRILVATPTPRYFSVLLYRGSSRTRRLIAVHKLVALAFHGPCPEGCEVDHIDTDKANNRATNLEYVTGTENRDRAARSGLLPTGDRNGSRRRPETRPRGTEHGLNVHPEARSNGERNGQAKATEAIVRTIRDRYAAGGCTHLSLARDHGLSEACVARIVNRKTWLHVE